jgi:hypothetical protein
VQKAREVFMRLVLAESVFADSASPWPQRSDAKLLDPAVPSFDEVDGSTPVLLVRVDIIRNRRRAKIVKGHEELHAKVFGHVTSRPDIAFTGASRQKT